MRSAPVFYFEKESVSNIPFSDDVCGNWNLMQSLTEESSNRPVSPSICYDSECCKMTDEASVSTKMLTEVIPVQAKQWTEILWEQEDVPP